MTIGSSITLSVTATGYPAPTYQWRKDGVAINGATASSLSLLNVQAADAGTYSVVVANPSGSVTSAGALLAITTLPGATVLPGDRRTIWNPGLNSVGGIPHRTTIYQTLSPSGGDDTAAIQTALNNCPEGQVVLLSPGTFLIGRTDATAAGLALRRSNITLRGSGSDRTQLVQRSGSNYPVVIIGPRWVKHTAARSLTADAAKGSYTITLSDASGLKVGELITLNQLSDDALRDDTHAPVRKVLWGSGAPDPTSYARGLFCEQNRPIGQTLEIQAIAGNQLTFTTPLHVGFETALDAHVTRFTSETAGDWNSPCWLVDSVKYSGIEDLAVSSGGGGDGGGNLHLWACAYCWIRNVDSAQSGGLSCDIENSFRCEIRDSYFHDGGDGIGLKIYSSDCLFENNIVWALANMTVCRASGGGNVFGYNYLQDGYGGGYPENVPIGGGPNSYVGAHMELFEGNESFNFDSEFSTGNTTCVTFFRNRATGLRVSAPPLQLLDAYNRRAIGVQTGSWWHSFLGNVLGYSGMQLLSGVDFQGNNFNQASFVYQAAIHDVANATSVPMWKIGYGSTTSPQEADTLVLARTCRHGNFDYVTNSAIWDATVADHALPASLYLTSKPPFFGANAWPWVTPENAPTTTATLPAKVRFNALKSAAATTYALWRRMNFEGPDLTNNAISGPLADPDGAGLPNLARYAFALAPRGPVAPPTTLGTASSGGQSYLTLAFDRHGAATDLTYVVEASSDLISWTPVPGQTFAPGTPTHLIAQDTVALGSTGATRRFLRVRVTSP